MEEKTQLLENYNKLFFDYFLENRKLQYKNINYLKVNEANEKKNFIDNYSSLDDKNNRIDIYKEKRIDCPICQNKNFYLEENQILKSLSQERMDKINRDLLIEKILYNSYNIPEKINNINYANNNYKYERKNSSNCIKNKDKKLNINNKKANEIHKIKKKARRSKSSLDIIKGNNSQNNNNDAGSLENEDKKSNDNSQSKNNDK